MNLTRLMALMALGWLFVTAGTLSAATPEDAALVTREYRIHLLRDPSPQEVDAWASQLRQGHHDARWLGDALSHTREGWDVRHSRLVLIRKTVFATAGMLALLALLYWMARRKPAPPGYARATGALLLFLLLSGVLLNILLLYTDPFPVPGYADDLFRNPAHNENDSWAGLVMVAREIGVNKDQTIYQHLLAGHGAKFQYPLTSTLLVVPIRDWPLTTPFLNSLCFALAWGIAALLAGLFVRGMGSRHVGFPWLLMGFILACAYTFTFYPILRGLLLGQAQTVILALFTTALFCYAKGRTDVAGVMMGLACTIKPQLGVLRLWGFTRKEFRFATWAFLTATAMGLISIGVYGLRDNLDYIRVLRFLGNHGEPFFANQSVNGLLNRAFFLGSNLSFNGSVYPPYNVWVHLGTMTAAAGLLLWALLWKGARSSKSNALATVDLSMAALAATMAAPIAWEHHYGLMLPMFAFVFPLTFIRRDKTGLTLLALSFILVSHSFAITNLLADTHLNVLQAYIFFGALLSMVQLHRLRRRLAQEDASQEEPS